MSTGTHRKADSGHLRIPAIPWGYLATGFALLAAAVALLVGLSILTAPTYAHAATRPAPAVQGTHGRTWADVQRRCNRKCKPVPPWLRRATGIRPCQPALMLTGDTTWIWVKVGRDGFRTIVS